MKFSHHSSKQLFVWIIYWVMSMIHCKYRQLLPKVVIGIAVRDKAFALPYFFHYIENLNYSKNRIGMIIYEYHSFDNSGLMIRKWCKENRDEYAFMDCEYYANVSDDSKLSKEPMSQIIQLRERILSESLLRWADYLLMIDPDVVLTNANVLLLLIEKLVNHNGGAISPLLNCSSHSLYSNFWDKMTPEGLYERTGRDVVIKHANKIGTFNVSVIDKIILFNLNQWSEEYRWFHRKSNDKQVDIDMVNLAVNARLRNITLLINNEQLFGYFPGYTNPSKNQYYIKKNSFTNLLFHFMLYNNYENPDSLKYDESLKKLDIDEYEDIKVNVDNVYVINLDRRKNRKTIIEYLLNLMRVNFQFFPAIDGNFIDENYLRQINISELKNYNDPFHKRRMTFGEIGCFLSHYLIWKEMVERNFTRIIVLEDDVKCTSEFPFVVNELISESDSLYSDWEFFYLGRKIMSKDKEQFLNSSRYLLIPNYSYRTTGYILTLNGAQRLINERPLEKIIALDEFIPIMYGKNPHKEWLQHFPGHGKLKAIACQPVLVEPSHFKGQKNYFSDTESSRIIYS